MKKGYKAFNKDLTCRGVKFKVGKVYELEGKPRLCWHGFHYCQNAFDVYRYYAKDASTPIAEIEDLGDTVTEGDKSATNKIKIVRLLTDLERLELWIRRTNSGDGNSGYGNSGNRNSGYENSGNRNSGDGNSGYGNSGNRNSGDWNSGDENSGNRNSGNKNSGDGNSGYGNSGNRNSGDWNSGDGNSGYFNTKVPVYFFNKPSDVEYSAELENKLRSINVKPIVTWVPSGNMTLEEQSANPSHKVTGGFLRKTGRHDWRYITEADKALIRSLPNFDDALFQVISNGVSLADTVKVLVNGVEKIISLKDAKKLGLV